MFFFLAKTLGVLIQAPSLLLEALTIGLILLWTRWSSAGRVIVSVAGVLIIILSITPASFLLLRPLEDRFPRREVTQAPTGIIVLGGAADEVVSVRRGAPTLNDASERIVESAALAHKFPTARLVFSGGGGRINGVAEANIVRDVWISLGLDPQRMTFEDHSRDTWENAVLTRNMIQPKSDETWLLVTSAAHMPRSVGIFRKIAFPVIPYPVDYRTSGTEHDFVGLRRPDQSAEALEIASHEWLGLVSYFLAGKTNAFFPAP